MVFKNLGNVEHTPKRGGVCTHTSSRSWLGFQGRNWQDETISAPTLRKATGSLKQKQELASESLYSVHETMRGASFLASGVRRSANVGTERLF